MNFIFIYITNPTRQEAKKIAKHLLKKRLIACANIFPIGSFYWRENKISEDKEFILIAKTIEKNYGKVKEEVEKTHSYSIPCIVKIPVSSNKKYFDWLGREIEK
jgi:periplasmic divalent cation tolerance protein